MGWGDNISCFWSGFKTGVSEGGSAMVDGFKELYQTGKELATSAAKRQETWEATKRTAGSVRDYGAAVADDPAKAWRDTKNTAAKAHAAYQDFSATATPEDWGRVVGRGTFEVGSVVVPVGVAGIAGKAAAAASVASKLPRAARLVDKAEDLADLVDDVPDLAPGSCNVCVKGPNLPDDSTDLAKSEKFGQELSEGLEKLGIDDAQGVVQHTASANNLPTGQWLNINESMSDAARAYQTQITGSTGQSFVVNGVKFDGVSADGATLLEAKGPNYSNFVNSTSGEFQPWFSGQDALLDQANRQILAAGGARIQWSVAEPQAASAMQSLLNSNGIVGIKIVVVPPL